MSTRTTPSVTGKAIPAGVGPAEVVGPELDGIADVGVDVPTEPDG
jgi:hypothetical protein